MLRFFYSKGSSALAAHILLEEVGAPYSAIEVSIPKKDHLSEAYLARNPKGRIPLLQTPDGPLSENPAILEYIASTHADAQVLPGGPYAQAQARSLAAYLCATAHIAFAHKQRGARWATEESSIADMQGCVAQNMADCAAFLEADLAFGPWALGASYSWCDPYLFLIGRWMEAAGVAMSDYPNLAAHRQAMLARPATQTALAAHDLG